MRRLSTGMFTLKFSLFFILCLYIFPVFNGLPASDLFSYNGVLLDKNGNILAKNTKVDFQVFLYNSLNDGQLGFSQALLAVSVRNGYFTLKIGPSLPDLNIYRYLELNLNGELLKPRIELVPVALAIHSVSSLVADLADDAVLFAGRNPEEYASYLYNEGLYDRVSTGLLNAGHFISTVTSSRSSASIELLAPAGIFFLDSVGSAAISTRIAIRSTEQDLFSLRSDGTISAKAYYGDGSNLSGVGAESLRGLEIVGDGVVTLYAGATLSGFNSGDKEYPFATAEIDGLLQKEDWQRFNNKADQQAYLLPSDIVNSLDSTATNQALAAAAGHSLFVDLQDLQYDLQTHIEQSNPHQISKANLGLTSVENVNVYKSWVMDSGEVLVTSGLRANTAAGLKIADFSGSGYWHMKGAGLVDLRGSESDNALLDVKGRVKALSFEGSGVNLSGVLFTEGSQKISGSLTANSFHAVNGFYGDGSHLSGIDKQKIGLSDVANINVLENWSQEKGFFIGTERIQALDIEKGLRLSSHQGRTGLLIKENSSGFVGVSMGLPEADFTAASRLQIVGQSGQSPLQVSTSVGTDAVFFISDQGFLGLGVTDVQQRLQLSDGAMCVGSPSYCGAVTNSEGHLYVSSLVAELLEADEILSHGEVRATSFVAEGADYAEYFLAEEWLMAGTVVGLNQKTGRVRAYQSGDPLLGVVSSDPSVLANNSIAHELSVPVALLGQVQVNEANLIKDNQGRLLTADGLLIGYFLFDGRVWLQPDKKQNMLSTPYSVPLSDTTTLPSEAESRQIEVEYLRGEVELLRREVSTMRREMEAMRW